MESNNIIDKRTKGEWKVSENVMGELAIVVTGQSGEYNRHICTLPMLSKYAAIGDEYEANAAFICKAVNNYDSLLEALKRLLSAGQEALDYKDGSGKPILQEAIWKYYELLNKLKQ